MVSKAYFAAAEWLKSIKCVVIFLYYVVLTYTVRSFKCTHFATLSFIKQGKNYKNLYLCRRFIYSIHFRFVHFGLIYRLPPSNPFALSWKKNYRSYFFLHHSNLYCPPVHLKRFCKSNDDEEKRHWYNWKVISKK